MAQAGNRAGKTQPCMQMGENELEWVSVTSGNMNVLNSVFKGASPGASRTTNGLGLGKKETYEECKTGWE